MSWDQIPGWFAFQNTYDKMINLAKDGDTIVEIGVAFGRSLAYLANRAMASGKNVRVVGVDPWIDDWETFKCTWGGEYAGWARAQGGPFNAFMTAMKQHAPAELEYSQIWRMKSADAVKLIEDGSCAGVLIDGNHYDGGIDVDISLWNAKIRPGGILAGDDYAPQFPDVIRAVQKMPECTGYYVDGTTWVVQK